MAKARKNTRSIFGGRLSIEDGEHFIREVHPGEHWGKRVKREGGVPKKVD